MVDTGPTQQREKLHALRRRRRPQRALDPDAALPGEDALLRKMIAHCTNAARNIYRRNAPSGRFSLADALAPIESAALDAQAAQEMNWEELLVWGSVLDVIEELTSVSRQGILQFALETCAPTNREMIKLAIAQHEYTRLHSKILPAVEAIAGLMPTVSAGARANRNQATRAKQSRNKNITLPSGRRYELVISALAKIDEDSHTEIDLWNAFKAKLMDGVADPREVSDASGKRDKLRMEFLLANGRTKSMTFRGLMNAIRKKRKTS